MIYPNKIIKEYLVEEAEKRAIITFENDIFKNCTYHLSGTYNYGDWMFLEKVAKRIREISLKEIIPKPS